MPYVLLVMASAYLFGAGPGILAFIIGITTYVFIFVSPHHAFWPLANSAEGWARLTSFFAGSAVVGVAAVMMRRSKLRIQGLHEESESLREQAEQQAAQLRSFMSSMADGVCVTDDRGNILWMNDSGRGIIDLPPDQPLGDLTKLYRVLTSEGEPIPEEETIAFRVIHGEVIKDLREKLVTSWGKETIISISAAPVCDSQGRITGATFVFRDQSERVDIEQYKEKQLDREHHIAEILQQALVPEQAFCLPCCEVAARYVPALEEAEVGGDFYDVFEIGEEKVGILIGDVVGKGLSAAVQVAAARHTIRSYAYLDPRPSRVLTLTNEALSRESTEDVLMITAIFAIVDVRLGTLSYANGGHGALLLQRSDGITEEIEIAGRALGIQGGYEYREDSTRLQSGDTVVLVTDGITESRVGTNEFGIKGAAEYLFRFKDHLPDQIADGLVESAKKYAGGSLRDDAAVVVFRYNP
jgi:serine phosphatase RsbU (regulator of sigma subunit)